jgi:hypothetical protein
MTSQAVKAVKAVNAILYYSIPLFLFITSPSSFTRSTRARGENNRVERTTAFTASTARSRHQFYS